MVSIIIPVYNVEKYLDKCIESALKIQVEKEIILVNDGSTDSSGIICDSWAEKEENVRVIHKSNGGLSSARNEGVLSANGDYILFLDSDDFYDVEETEKVLANIDSKTDIILGLYNEYYEESDIYSRESCDELLRMHGQP